MTYIFLYIIIIYGYRCVLGGPGGGAIAARRLTPGARTRARVAMHCHY